MNFLANPAFFEYFSPRYKIYDLVYFNCLISFINSYPTPIHPLSYSQRGKKNNTHLITSLWSFMVFPPVHFMQWSYGLESSFPSFPPAASILNSIVTSLRRLFVTAPHTHTTKSLLLAPSGSTSLTDTMATFPCGFRAGATSALFAALSHRVLGTQQVLNMYFLNKSTIQWSNRTCDQQRKQKSSQNYPHTLTHILISPQKSFKKGHNTVSFVSEQSSMYM